VRIRQGGRAEQAYGQTRRVSVARCPTPVCLSFRAERGISLGVLRVGRKALRDSSVQNRLGMTKGERVAYLESQLWEWLDGALDDLYAGVVT
jgi:hypothetical protein